MAPASPLRRWWRAVRRVASPTPAHPDRFRVILETVQSVGLMLDVDGRITFANDFLLGLTGWRREEVLGRPWFGLFVPADAELERLFRDSVARGEVFAHHENPIATRDGRLRTIAWDNVILWDDDGRVAGTASIGRDVTDERAAIEALARTEAEIARREHEAERAARLEADRERRRLQLVIDRLPVGVVVTDANGVVVQHNELAPRLLGHPVHATRGVEDFALYGGAHADGTPYAAHEYPGARALHGEVVEQESIHWRRDDGWTTLSFNAAPVYEDGGLAYAVVTFVDVTAREVARTALHEASEALRENDRRKDEFLATLAHELRNPLAPLRNAVEILRRSREPASTDLARGIIERQLGQMVRLVDDLLDVSRIATGKLNLQRERLRLDEVVARAVETSRPKIDGLGHRLVVDVPPQPIPLHGDGVRLAQVLTNLLNNAAKYTEPGGTITLAVREPRAGRVRIEVRDTGIGLAPDALAHVFELFSQVETTSARAQGGLGIGLTIAQRIVELHGGTIVAASEGPGRGATFAVELPVGGGGSAEESPSFAVAPRHGKCRVVIADDNRDAADSLALMLRLSGHEAHVAYDGEEAVALVERVRPDVVLVDLGMPRLDGYGVARRLRASPSGRRLAIAALTGWGQAADRAATAAAGFDHHFTKPVDPADVEAVLAGLPHCSRPAARG